MKTSLIPQYQNSEMKNIIRFFFLFIFPVSFYDLYATDTTELKRPVNTKFQLTGINDLSSIEKKNDILLGTLSGTVKEKNSNNPLAGATVYIPDL